jgi:hypothetical protein
MIFCSPQTDKISKRQSERGLILSGTLVFASIAILVTIGLTSWLGVTLTSVRTITEKEQAFQIAEAGIDYYRWHLAHAPQDFQDGTGQPGPYVHDFFDKDGNKIGEFSLDIIAPPEGSTLVTIESTGTLASSSAESIVRAQLALPSLAKYAVVANDAMRFGEGTEVYGPIHSNDGIRFDGLAHNIISSSQYKYKDPDHGGAQEFGVHTHVSPVDPIPDGPNDTPPERPDVFLAGREIGVAQEGVDGLITNFADLKDRALENGLYGGYTGRNGYLLQLQTDDTLRAYEVSSLENVPDSSCQNQDSSEQDWGTWSVRNTRYLGEFDFPENGIIFIEDNVWVEGQIDGARLTIAAGRFPDTPSRRPSITVNNDVRYTNYDGSDVIALMAQDNINVGLYSEDDLRIDAALVAQHGRVGRFHYTGPYEQRWWTYPGCSPYHVRSTITLYGMIATNERYGFAYTDDTGYQTRNIIYDSNLLFGPPPEFPLAGDQYETILWEVVK